MADRMSQQLQQMREMGLRDQVFNLQALQITNGDVQAAIELVMSSGNNGRDEDDEDENAFRQ
jgi:ABC-type branched-subunit amino acid transport system substrate-binding protein